MPDASKSDQDSTILAMPPHGILLLAQACYTVLKTLQRAVVSAQKRFQNEEVISPHLCLSIIGRINEARQPVQKLYHAIEKQTQLPEPLLSNRLHVMRLLHGIATQADEMKSNTEAFYESILVAKKTSAIQKSDLLRQLSEFYASLGDTNRLLRKMFGKELDKVDKSMLPASIYTQNAVQPLVSTNGENAMARDDFPPGSTRNTLHRQPITMERPVIEKLVEIITKHAANSPGDPNDFFRDLIRRADIPDRWKWEMAGAWEKNVQANSRKLIDWSLTKDINPDNPRPQFTILGSILETLLREVGAEDAIVIAGLLVVYEYCLDQQLRENLAIHYQIPLVIEPRVELVDTTLHKAWRGPLPPDDSELQSFLKPEPPLLDVGFLMRAVARAASVCRIELPRKGRQGTGFLIANNLLLTNYHIFEEDDNEVPEENIREANFRFGCITLSQGQENKGQLFKASTTNAVRKASPTNDLDYLLLRIEDKITQAQGILVAPYSLQTVNKATCVHILQHPEGETMKLAISSNGVTQVYQDHGLVQYVTRTASGSSGAPCFNDDWEVVALHHAEHSRSFGSIREGILFPVIHNQIKEHLP